MRVVCVLVQLRRGSSTCNKMSRLSHRSQLLQLITPIRVTRVRASKLLLISRPKRRPSLLINYHQIRSQIRRTMSRTVRWVAPTIVSQRHCSTKESSARKKSRSWLSQSNRLQRFRINRQTHPKMRILSRKQSRNSRKIRVSDTLNY